MVRCHGRILSHFTQPNVLFIYPPPPPPPHLHLFYLSAVNILLEKSIYIRLILFIQIGQPGGSGDTGPKGYEVRKRQDDCENKILGLSLECF